MKCTLKVDEDGFLQLTDELIEITGWKEGDDLLWEDQGDGSYTLTKIDK